MYFRRVLTRNRHNMAGSVRPFSVQHGRFPNFDAFHAWHLSTMRITRDCMHVCKRNLLQKSLDWFKHHSLT